MALGIPAVLNVDNKAPEHVQFLAADITDALNRFSAELEDHQVADDTSFAALTASIAALTAVISNVVAASYTANADLTATIPADDTPPQVGEGTEILSVTITPTSNTSKVMLRGHGWGHVSADVSVMWAVFSSQSADAVQAGFFTASGLTATWIGYTFNILHAPATTSAVTYSVRVGPISNTLRLNGSVGARYFGGSSSAYLTAEEIPV